MIKELQKYVMENSRTCAYIPTLNEGAFLSVAKFCQRLVAPHTKVLFLVTGTHGPVCILKIVRSVEYNERLKKECAAQKYISSLGGVPVPRVYFEGTVCGHFVYAEEVVIGNTLTRKEGQKREREIVRSIATLPKTGEVVQTDTICEIVKEQIPAEAVGVCADALEGLSSYADVLPISPTHSDLGRVNILVGEDRRLFFIDWERANRKPIWLFDAVYFLYTLYGITNITGWRTHAAKVLEEETGCSSSQADALYYVVTLFTALRKKYPTVYERIVDSTFSHISL